MNMKIIISILICRFVYFVGKIVKKGSSLPGKIVLKLFPSILSKIKMPKTVIAVSGSNGKTSTVEMIAHVLTGQGAKVIYNKEGSNQIEGVATFLSSVYTVTPEFDRMGCRLSGAIILLTKR